MVLRVPAVPKTYIVWCLDSAVGQTLSQTITMILILVWFRQYLIAAVKLRKLRKADCETNATVIQWLSMV